MLHRRLGQFPGPPRARRRNARLTEARASEYIDCTYGVEAMTMAGRGKQVARRTQEQRRLQTQAAILAAAVELLTEIGYARFSASGVAARAGVSRGALEHYYPRKIDL